MRIAHAVHAGVPQHGHPSAHAAGIPALKLAHAINELEAAAWQHIFLRNTRVQTVFRTRPHQTRS